MIDWAMAVALVAALGAGAGVMAWLLRRCAVPGGVQGAALCAGVFVGLIAGPGVGARAWPGLFGMLVRGGAPEARDVAQLERQHGEELLALRTSGVTSEAIEEHAARQRAELEPAGGALSRARARRGEWNDRALVAVSAVVMLIGAVGSARRTRRGRRTAPHRRRGGEALAGGLLLAVGVGGAWLGALFAPSPPTGGRVGALALGAIAPFAPGMTRSAHGAARVAWCGVTALCLLPLDPRLSVVAVLALVGAAIGAAAPKRLRRGALDLLWTLAVPALAALVALRVDLRALDPSSWAVWFSLAPALVWCSDGRMLASWLALRASGAPMPWTGAARMVNAGALAPHLVFTGAGFASGLLSNTTLTACVASALLLSITPGARRLFARLIEPPRG